MFSRLEDSKLSDWYFEIDWSLLLSVFLLIGVGIIALFIAGSVSAERIRQPWYFFIQKSIVYYILGVSILLITSMFNKKWILSISSLNFIIGFVLLLLTVFISTKIKGSARWINLGAINIMPSDIMKPGFVLMTSLFFSKMKQHYDNLIFNKKAWIFKFKSINWWYYLVPFLAILIVLYKQPDIGNLVIYFGIFASIWFIVENSKHFFIVFWCCIITMLFFVSMKPHFIERIKYFINDGYQVTKSIQSIQNGGLIGRWSDSFVKQSLPDSHTDFVFSAITEDVGAIVASCLIFVYFHIIARLITLAQNSRDVFTRCMILGTIALFGGHTIINLLSALGIIPPKGTVLPFVSYGGSAFVSFCLLFGIIIGLIRIDKWKI